MTKGLIIPIACICIAAFSSCKSALLIERSEAHRKEARQIDKIISIDPQFMLVDTRKGADNFYLRSEQKDAYFNQTLIKSAKKAGIELITVNKEDLSATDLDYFNYLAPLKKQIMISNTIQDVAVKRKRGRSGSGKNWIKPSSKEFKQVPIFSSEFSELADKYGTPYFAVHGVSSAVYKRRIPWGTLILIPPLGAVLMARPNAETFYFTAVVNVNTSEVVYREVRYVNRSSLKDVIDPMVYDSFRVLRKPGKK